MFESCHLETRLTYTGACGLFDGGGEGGGGGSVRLKLLVMCRSVRKLLIPYCLCLPSSDGTWWTRIVTEWLKLPALYDVCAVFSLGRRDAQVVRVLHQER